MLSKVNLIVLACLALFGGAAIFSASAADPRAESFNDGWKFSLGDAPEMASPDYDDSNWRNLSLPHDWAIEGDFNIDNPSGTGGGALPGGIGWYRKSFTISPAQQDKKTFIDFDGAYMNSI